jgi:6-methylsalicylate decarboxylase
MAGKCSGSIAGWTAAAVACATAAQGFLAGRTMTAGMIDVHFHLIPQFFREAVHEAGFMLATASYPDWSPPSALDLMDKHGIAVAIASTVWPGAGFLPGEKAATFARRCNDYAAELIAQHPKRFGCFGLLPMHDMDAAIAEARRCLETLHFEGIGLFASYGERFLGDTFFDPLMSYLNTANAVVHVHPTMHPSSRTLKLPWPGWLIEYVFDTTRAAVNLIFTGAMQRFPAIRFILSHAGGTLPYIAMRLELAPMIEASLQTISREQIVSGLRTFWYDSAIASGPQTMGALSRVAAKDHIVFGSDWPFCDHRVVAEEVTRLTAPDFLVPDEVAMIGRNNALALFPRRAAQFK